MKSLKLHSILNNVIIENSDNKVAIFKIFHGKKHFAIRLNDSGKIDLYDSGVKYTDLNVLKFDKIKAIEVIKKSTSTDDTFGIVDSSGIQSKIKN